ncbi:Gfo/Idh/MocA family protein [Dictyobacter aurantiacus]|uniref:Oxidoreductase n=1 Tax=Dictyobacter aurantiacus TaxID=1936993 RepID=A0A401ZQC4_9CHLR|nr:Gfo/Idh/MocA family oxidoreductase [Dictyobacter aurantiacus]GCE08984.1 oxidoreductase [Dictyobacter aurantiacus]
MQQSVVGVGVIGVGGISGYVHLPGLRACEQAKIVALCDVNEALAQQRAQEYGVEHVYTRYQDLLARPDIDAVVIATPTVMHAPIALAAIAAGKHLLVEKQLAMNYAEAVQMYEAARKAGVQTMTAFTYRFVPGMRYLKHLLRRGDIGTPRHVRVARLQEFRDTSLGWRQKRELAGSGEIGDMGAHRIDFCLDLIGPIERVAGLKRTFIPLRNGADGQPIVADVEDCAVFIAEFGGDQGAVASFDLSKVARGRGSGGKSLDEFEVYGTDGTLVYHLHHPHEILVGRPGGMLETVRVPDEFLTYPGSSRKPLEGDPTTTFRYDQDFAFIQAILQNNDEDIPTFYDGMRCQAVIDAVVEATESRQWVEVMR